MARKSKSRKFKMNGREYLSFNHPELKERLCGYSVNYVVNLAASSLEKVDSYYVANRRYICPETTVLMLKLGLNVEGAYKIYQGGSVNRYGFREDLLESVKDVLSGPFSFASVHPSKQIAELIPSEVVSVEPDEHGKPLIDTLKDLL